MKKAIGVLGGMGPQAGVAFCNKLIELSASEFGAITGDQFPEIVFNSIPVPDFFASTPNQKKALKMLIARVKELNNLNIGFFGIACNTAHLLLPEIQKNSKIPFISMIDEVALAVKKEKIKKVGLFASPTTLRSQLFQKSLAMHRIEAILPDEGDFSDIEKTIGNIIAGKFLESDSQNLERIATCLKNKGAQGIILGCTELPLAFPKEFSLPIFNSSEVLARALLRKYFK